MLHQGLQGVITITKLSVSTRDRIAGPVNIKLRLVTLPNFKLNFLCKNINSTDDQMSAQLQMGASRQKACLDR